MELPQVLTALIQAQDDFDSHAYANCFSETAIVEDEKKTYKGRAEIQQWIQKANEDYQTKIKPLEYSKSEQMLSAEISGTFEGSPLEIKFYYKIDNGLIQSMKTD